MNRVVERLSRITALVLLLLVVVLAQALAGSVSVKVIPAVVEKGKSVTLTISVDSSSLATPDLAVLKKDFQILKKTNSSSIHQLNGVTLIKKNWVIVLLPRKQGKLRIPVIKVGYERTPPLTLVVNEPQQEAFNIDNFADNKQIKQDKKDIFIKVEADISETYVQGQIVITQKIFHAIPLQKANLSVPELELLTDNAAHKKLQDNDKLKGRGRNTIATEVAAELIPLSQTPPYYWRFNGKRYHVIERSYALFPKHSGNFRLRSATLTGLTNSAHKDELLSLLTGGEGTTKVVVHAPVLTLKVKPQRGERTDETWLPAKNITLYAKRLNPEQNPAVDKPLIFQLGIIADGLRAEQLPDIKLDLAKHIKTYAEPAMLDNTITFFGVTGVWSQKITLIPQFGGDFVIPEFRLPWWNVTTDHREVAILPAQVLSVAGSVADNVADNVPVNAAGGFDHKNAMDGEAKVSTLEGQGKDNHQSAGLARFSFATGWSVLVFLLLFFGYLLYRMHREKHINNTVEHIESNRERKKDILHKMQQACIENRPEKVAVLLPLWAEKVAGIYPATMEGIAHAENGFLQDEISTLSQVLYGRRATNKWQGAEFWRVIKKYPTTAAEQPQRGSPSEIHLQEMYPH